MKNLNLKNGTTAKFLREDYWGRPVYLIDGKIRACCVNLNGTFLHTMTTYGEPIAPLRAEYQPISDQ